MSRSRVAKAVIVCVAWLAPLAVAPAARADSCPADTNLDFRVDVNDLNNVILDWGTDGSSNGGDVTGPVPGSPPDGIVNVNDLNAVIVGWGDCPLKNDQCAGALPLEDWRPRAGSTTLSTPDTVPDCVNPYPPSPGNWYRVAGDGLEKTITLSDFDFAARFRVYCEFGSCDPVCTYNEGIAEGDDLVATICTDPEREYLVLVDGHRGETGSYVITLTISYLCVHFETCVVPAVAPSPE